MQVNTWDVSREHFLCKALQHAFHLNDFLFNHHLLLVDLNEAASHCEIKAPPVFLIDLSQVFPTLCVNA